MMSPTESYLRRHYSQHVWEPTHPATPHTIMYRLVTTRQTLCVTIADDAGTPLRHEAQRLTWLADNNIPCPTVIDYGTHDHEYLVTTTLPGRPASACWPRNNHTTIIDACADFLKILHRTPINACPYDQRLRVTIPAATENATLGDVDTTNFPQWTIPQLITELITTARLAGREEPTLTHGSFRLAHITICPTTLHITGVTNVARLGIADRYTDLATITQDITKHPQYTTTHANRFMYRYNEIPADPTRITLYRLLDQFFAPTAPQSQ